jgi:DNA-binding IclR family transcriptional regulator
LPKQSGPRRIQSIEVGFALIRALEVTERPLSLKDLAAKAGMAPSKALLYLASFTGLGLVSRDASSQYSLGPYALQLGLVALRRISLVEAAPAPMQALRAATRHSVHVSIWGNRGPVIVLKLDSEIPSPMSIRVGYVLPLMRSATGKIFVTHLPCRLIRPVVEMEGGKNFDAQRKAIQQAVSRAGVAASDSQLNIGFAALSAAIFDYRNEIAGAITLLAPRESIDTDPQSATAGLLKSSAASISKSLGMPPQWPVAKAA